MEITRNSGATRLGETQWFTGNVYVDAIATPIAASRVVSSLVHFAPGARTAWHTHPLGQTIFVTEGIGLCQRDGGPVEIIRPGDRVFFDPGENHWHGASAERLMVHVAIVHVDEQGKSADWGNQVTDAEYGAIPVS